MRPVGTKDMIVHSQKKGLANRGCFLPDGQVSGALVIVFDSFIGSLGLNTLEHALELANEQHVLVDSDKGFGPVGLDFLF